MRQFAVTLSVIAAVICLQPVVRADDAAEVKSAEVAFNDAQNAGSTDGMFKYMLPERTVFGTSGDRLAEGWTEESKRVRQAAFDAGRKIDLKIQDFEVTVYGDAAVTTFYRIGTIKEVDGKPEQKRYRISGVWVRRNGQWKLAHRHESPLAAP